ncbi:hypothetical protein Bphy_5664 (plasmid) [Paraburkholderia phymatum STM815]|uniref:Uncharacterized protein n=2 Tax=Paraburkholderia phymatum TaxID=148447 RepID=B2JUV9_PARP8|nr:hypothetical protein Bphy_5664 [Paraburkholderia phymatum STM815]
MSRLADLMMQHRSVETEIALRELELNTCRLSIDEQVAAGTSAIPPLDTLTFLEAQLRLWKFKRERLRLAIARCATGLLVHAQSASRVGPRTRCPGRKSVSVACREEKHMFDYPGAFHVDPTPRRADGEYIAHARISRSSTDGHEYDVHLSGDLRGFDAREDAIRFAAEWATEWLETHCASHQPQSGDHRQ